MKRLRKQEAGEAVCAQPWVVGSTDPRRGSTWDVITEPSPPQSPGLPPHTLPALSCSSSSASDFICFPDNVDFDTSPFQGLPEVWVLPGKTQQLRSVSVAARQHQHPREGILATNTSKTSG